MRTWVTEQDRVAGRLGRFVKATLGWLAIVLLGYFALAAVRHSTPPPNEVMGVPFDGGTGAAVPQRDEPPLTTARVSAPKVLGGIQEPRECDASKGVTSSCVFE